MGTEFGLPGTSLLIYKLRNQLDSGEGSINNQCFLRATGIVYQTKP